MSARDDESFDLPTHLEMLRTKREKSQEQFARDVGIDGRTLRRWRAGQPPKANSRDIDQLIARLDLNADEAASLRRSHARSLTKWNLMNRARLGEAEATRLAARVGRSDPRGSLSAVLDRLGAGARQFAEFLAQLRTLATGNDELVPEWFGRFFAALGRHDLAIGHYKRALAALHAEQVRDRGRLLSDLGLAYTQAGHLAEGDRALAAALRIFEDLGDPIWCSRAASHYTTLKAQIGAFAEMQALVTDHPPRRDDPYGIALAEYAHGFAQLMLGNLDMAEVHARRSLAAARNARWRPLLEPEYLRDLGPMGGYWREAHAHQLLGTIAVHGGNWQKAEREYDAALRVGPERGPNIHLPYLSVFRFQVWVAQHRSGLLTSKQLESNVETIQQALQTTRQWWGWVMLMRQWGWYKLSEGDQAGARRLFDAAEREAKRRSTARNGLPLEYAYELLWIYVGLGRCVAGQPSLEARYDAQVRRYAAAYGW
ncbi:MAG: hypothetical protein AB7R89_03460 [Dehalococcoidia bacterium]